VEEKRDKPTLGVAAAEIVQVEAGTVPTQDFLIPSATAITIISAVVVVVSAAAVVSAVVAATVNAPA